MTDNLKKRDDDTGFFGRNGTLQGVSEALSAVKQFRGGDAVSRASGIGKSAEAINKVIQLVAKFFA